MATTKGEYSLEYHKSLNTQHTIIANCNLFWTVIESSQAATSNEYLKIHWTHEYSTADSIIKKFPLYIHTFPIANRHLHAKLTKLQVICHSWNRHRVQIKWEMWQLQTKFHGGLDMELALVKEPLVCNISNKKNKIRHLRTKRRKKHRFNCYKI